MAARPDDSTSWSIDLQHAEQPKTPRTDELVPGFGETEPASSEFYFRPNRRTFAHLDVQSLEGALGLDWNVSRQRYFGVAIPVWYPLDANGQRDYAHPIAAEQASLPIDLQHSLSCLFRSSARQI